MGFSGISAHLTVQPFSFLTSRHQRSRRSRAEERAENVQPPPRPTNSAGRESTPCAPRPPRRSARTAQAWRQKPFPAPRSERRRAGNSSAPSTKYTPICASLRSHICSPASDAPGKNRISHRAMDRLKDAVCSPRLAGEEEDDTQPEDGGKKTDHIPSVVHVVPHRSVFKTFLSFSCIVVRKLALAKLSPAHLQRRSDDLIHVVILVLPPSVPRR